MADKDAASSTQQPQKPAGSTSVAAGDAAAKAPKGNPAFRMMGLPNFRLKLPSRNWLIFIGITSSWTAAIIYDRREKKRRQKKWCDTVRHLAQEPLPTSRMPRRLSVFLGAPPADGLMRAREYFHEYVKPVLVAAGVDWDVIEGRREGDVRAGLAERIRAIRKRDGETSVEPLEQDRDLAIWQLRQRAGIRDWDGTQGDVIIGRHVWKEYVRGLHEGWLGPLDPPPPPPEELAATPPSEQEKASDLKAAAEEVPMPESPLTTSDIFKDPPPSDSTPPEASTDASSAAKAEAEAEKTEEKKEEESKPAKKKQPPPFISTDDYSGAHISTRCPPILGPSTTVPFPHLLGFFNFPIRIYRYLNQRSLADDAGRAAAAAVLAAYEPYSSVPAPDDDSSTESGGMVPEQTRMLDVAEKDWHKSTREPREDNKERVWTNDMVLDPRVAERMRKFVVEAAEEARAERIYRGQEKPIDLRAPLPEDS